MGEEVQLEPPATTQTKNTRPQRGEEKKKELIKGEKELSGDFPRRRNGGGGSPSVEQKRTVPGKCQGKIFRARRSDKKREKKAGNIASKNSGTAGKTKIFFGTRPPSDS